MKMLPLAGRKKQPSRGTGGSDEHDMRRGAAVTLQGL